MPVKSGSRWGAGRVAFLANIDKFRALLDAGHTARSIYDDHADVLGIGYQQFIKLIGKHIKGNDGHQRKTNAAAGPAKTPSQPAATRNDHPAGTGHVGKTKPVPFQHNPGSGNDRDDLI